MLFVNQICYTKARHGHNTILFQPVKAGAIANDYFDRPQRTELLINFTVWAAISMA